MDEQLVGYCESGRDHIGLHKRFESCKNWQLEGEPMTAGSVTHQCLGLNTRYCHFKAGHEGDCSWELTFDTLSSLRTRNSELEEGIRKFGQHKCMCTINLRTCNSDPMTCSCGFEQFLALLPPVSALKAPDTKPNSSEVKK